MALHLDPDFDATRPASLEETPLRSATPAVPALRLLVKGFSEMEHRLLEGTVRLSQRRSPHLDLLEDATADTLVIWNASSSHKRALGHLAESACGECKDERPADRAVGAESARAGVLGEASASSSCCPVAI